MSKKLSSEISEMSIEGAESHFHCADHRNTNDHSKNSEELRTQEDSDNNDDRMKIDNFRNQKGDKDHSIDNLRCSINEQELQKSCGIDSTWKSNNECWNCTNDRSQVWDNIQDRTEDG